MDGAEGMKGTRNRVNGNAISSMPRRGEREKGKEGRREREREGSYRFDAIFHSDD